MELSERSNSLNNEVHYITQIFCGIFKLLLENYQEDFKFLPNILTEELLNMMNLEKNDIENVLRKILNSSDEIYDAMAEDDEIGLINTKERLFEVENYTYTNIIEKNEISKNKEEYEQIMIKTTKFIEELSSICDFKSIDITDALLIFEYNSLLGKMNESQIFNSLHTIFDLAKAKQSIKIDNNVII